MRGNARILFSTHPKIPHPEPTLTYSIQRGLYSIPYIEFIFLTRSTLIV
jgi:hypothetical protein